MEGVTRLISDLRAATGPRVPVIVGPPDRERWLDRSTGSAELAALMDRSSDPPLAARRVSTWVNDPAHDDPSCVEPLDEAS